MAKYIIGGITKRENILRIGSCENPWSPTSLIDTANRRRIQIDHLFLPAILCRLIGNDEKGTVT